MNRKELLERIKKEMPKNLDEKERAAFIMMRVAQDRSFSEHYYWGDASTSKKMYAKTVRPENIEPQNKRKLICVTATRLFKYIAQQFGLEVLYVGEDGIPIKNGMSWLKNAEHVYPAVRLSDGSLIKCDIQRDMHNIQTGCRWKFFGTHEFSESNILSKIPEEELDEIMRNIGYLKNNEIYTDDLCRKKSSEMNKDKTVTEIVDEVFHDKDLITSASKTSIIETYKFYGRVMDIYLGEECKRPDVFKKGLELTHYIDRFYMFPCKLNKNGENRYTICAYTNEDGNIGTIYMLSRTTRKMVQVSLEEFSFYERQGLRVPVWGTKILRKRIKEFRKTNIPQNTGETPRVDLEEFVDESADERG